MKKRLLIGSLLLFSVLIGGVVLIERESRVPEPVYQGKPLGEWLEEIDPKKSSSSGALLPSATAAVQAIGTNAIPWLLHEAANNNSGIKMLAHELLERQTLVRLRLPPLMDHQQRARRGFLALGTAGANAVAAGLTNSDKWIRHGCVGQWEIGQDYPDIIFEPMFQCLKDPEPMVRARAANAIGMLHPHPEKVVPVLIEMLDDREDRVRLMAALGLMCYGDKAKAAVPALLESLDHPSSEYEFWATNALKRIDPAALAKVKTK